MKRILSFCFIILLLVTACTSKRERAISAVKEGNTRDYASDFKGALESYSEAIEIDPEYAPAWFYRGNTLFNLKDIESAIKNYSKAIELKPTYTDAYANRGDAYFSLNRRDEACKDYRKAEQLGKENMYEKTKWCR
jgi:tetratricopeptide (TPR) repeat protein